MIGKSIILNGNSLTPFIMFTKEDQEFRAPDDFAKIDDSITA